MQHVFISKIKQNIPVLSIVLYFTTTLFDIADNTMQLSVPCNYLRKLLQIQKDVFAKNP